MTDEIASLEDKIEQLENKDYTELLNLHKEANQLEFELGRLESDWEDINDEISAIEDRLREHDQLEDRRAEIRGISKTSEYGSNASKTEAVEEFNEHMETVLNLLDYENIKRIWIERTKQTVYEGRRKVDKSVFKLHVVHTTRSGASYEDTIDHLSESEREVTGVYHHPERRIGGRSSG